MPLDVEYEPILCISIAVGIKLLKFPSLELPFGNIGIAAYVACNTKQVGTLRKV